jgi:valyl-tRNA synthetase
MGLIYMDKKVNNYCPVCRTTIADSEIEYKNISSTFNYVKFKVKGTRDTVVIGTTRPELIGACGMVIFNPKDERYKKLDGKTAIIPLYEKEVPIRAHPYATIEAGTGLMMMCSFGDYTDIRFFREMNLEPVILINSRGLMNDNAGFLEGMSVEEARKETIRRLEDAGLLEKQEKITHRTPVCERSKTEIEFIALSEYYLKQLDFKPEMKKIAKKTDFYAPRSRQILLDWINSLSMDWAISRRRYYATEIPLWYCKECSEPVVPLKGRYYKPWKEKPPIEKCHRCGCIEFEPETRVFDTWFDSSISPLYILKYHTNEKFFSKTEPCTLRPQGKEIVRTWLYYTLLRCYQLTKKSIFKDIWIHYHVLDEKGSKMSKSLGNVIDPLEVVEKFGAEPFRIWCALEGNITISDLKCSFARIEGASKFLTKLWNVARFVSMFKPVKRGIRLTDTDRWILKELYKLVKDIRKCYENYDFHSPIVAIKHFIWETFASHYIELVKSRAYNEGKKFTKSEQRGAIHTLNKVLEEILFLLYPIACFITHRIYEDVFRGDIDKKEFPKTNVRFSKKRLPFKTEDLVDLNSRIWKKKKDKGLSLKAPVKHAIIPSKFKKIEKDLKETHNIVDLKYGKRFNIRI